ncbi:hypothetical protein ABZX85_06310 [Streptomyces sp. NPDC004539]|uniref:hypothetical protein n=1 Tax=Streptomyces sp. NPDC004539 TaxID=3154280 RepID=UPI0033A3299F
MRRPPTAAQRRVIEGAEPVTGRLKGTAAQLDALVKRGLAFRHPRAPHDCFLTPAGHRLREETPEAAAPAPAPAPQAADGVFVARIGGEEEAGGPSRTREVHSAWQGLLELRRMTNPDGDIGRPCGWERTHLVRAAALALEAAGQRPAGVDRGDTGYRVRATPQPEAVAVYGAELASCARVLEAAGWQVGEHTEARSRERCLLASPRRR